MRLKNPYEALGTAPVDRGVCFQIQSYKGLTIPSVSSLSGHSEPIDSRRCKTQRQDHAVYETPFKCFCKVVFCDWHFKNGR
ncbi:hypothetical protein DPMN_023790 [Dreissena polymorpha]|uniref:Uncharacterized protein n=1 Tax=Dreissena polymorpha TaxID=45954 RepID=A0A9D4RBQ1_DREPO|nr:hypothetical protein DPMN_023790 [Dreissena polymorpha]